MLDDLKAIHERDSADALGIAEKESQQLSRDYPMSGTTEFSNIQTIVYAGMGGSALAARFVPTWPRLDRPFEIVSGYDIPPYVGPGTLFIASSYSGNTEETLSALNQAIEKRAQIAVITSGGKLQELTQSMQCAHVTLPDVGQPRYAVFSNFRALMQVLEAAGVLDDGYRTALSQAADKLTQAVKAWVPQTPTKQNPAKQLAQELIGKSIVIYGGPKLYPAAYKWKISFNENAKQIAWTDQFPEFNHNEFIGWSKQPTEKPYAVIELRGSIEHPRIQKRFDVTGRLLSGVWPEPYVVDAQGENALEQLLWAVQLGDFVSIYVALLNGINPTPVDLVENFKRAMAE